MAAASLKEAEMVLDRFVETMFRLFMEHHQKHIVELELTVPQAQALRVLRRGPLCTRELAAALAISAPAVTQLTDRMVRKDLLERRAVDGDRRSVLIALSNKGRRTIDGFRKRRNGIFSGALSNISEQDRAEVIAALGKLVTALEHFVSGTDEERPRSFDDALVKESQTADGLIESSNSTNRAGNAPARARMKLEWD